MGFFTGFVWAHTTQPLRSTSDELTLKHGFTEQFSGFALTTSLLYVTLQVHRSNRLDQQRAIREQTQLLNWLASPAGAYDRRFAPKEDPRPARIVTEERVREREREKAAHPSFETLLKYRWNKEIEALATKAYESRWEDARTTAVEGWKAVVRLMKKE